MKPQTEAKKKGPCRVRARGWHSPDGLQAPLDGLGGDEACSSIVDLVGQAEAHLQPAVDVQPHNARRAQAADSRSHYCQGHYPLPKTLPVGALPSTPLLPIRGNCKWRPLGQESIFPDLSMLKRRKCVLNTYVQTVFLTSPELCSLTRV